MIPIFSSVLSLLMAVAVVVGVYGVVTAFREKMRELETRETRASAKLRHYRPNAERAAARRSKPA